MTPTFSVLAQADGAAGLASFLPIILIVVIFYFLLIRPQQKRTKQQRQLVNSLETGDRVVSIGGMYGTLTSVDDDTVRVEVSPGTTVTMAKQAISRRLNEDDAGDDE